MRLALLLSLLAGAAWLGFRSDEPNRPTDHVFPASRPQIPTGYKRNAWVAEPPAPLNTSDGTVAAAETLPIEAAQRNGEAVALAEVGAFDEAAAILRELAHDFPDSTVVRRNLRAVLTAIAARTRDEGNVPAALDLLEEAVRFGESPEVLGLLGSLRLEIGDVARALDDLSRAHDLAPTDVGIALAVARAYIEADRRDRALDVLLTARERGARHAAIDAMIERTSRELDAEWDFVRIETDHFELDFEPDTPSITVDEVAAQLDEAFVEVTGKLGVRIDGTPRAVLYPEVNFHALTQTPDWTQGVFDGRVKVPVGGLELDDPRLGAILRHETAHHVVAELGRERVPVWLNEGIAMWAEEIDDERRSWSEERLVGRPIVPLRQLQRPFSQLEREAAEAAYAQS